MKFPGTQLDLEELPARVPLFPLPNVIALPGVALHLHVFEQRYRHMVEDLDTENPYLAMAVIQKGWEDKAGGDPPLMDIVTVGRVSFLAPLEEGRYFMIFQSMGRAQLLNETSIGLPYRMGDISWLVPEFEDQDPGLLSLRLQVYRSFERYAKTNQNLLEELKVLRGLGISLGREVDMLASRMPLDMDLQRRFLGELNDAKRALLLLTILQSVNGTRDMVTVH